MADIRIAVDQPTFDQWLSSLVVLRQTYLLPLTFTTPVAGISTPPQSALTTGERLLLDIGRACSRPDVLDDPGRLFAVFRYALAISSRHPVLTLSPSYKGLDTHKKKVLSDEFGCGAAFLIAGELLGANNFLDLETAVAYGLVATTAPRSRRPDYIAPLNSGRLLVLEAKGNQQSSQYSVQVQIPKGCDQVSRVAVVAPGDPQIDQRIVAATSLSFADWGPNTRTCVGDPPERELETYTLRESVEVTARRLHYLRVAAFLGDTALATVMQGHDATIARLPMVSRSVNDQPYQGSQLTLEAGGRRLGVFVGIHEHVRRELLSGGTSPLLRQHIHLQTGAKLSTEDLDSFEPSAADRRHDPETVAAASDGTVWVTWQQS